MSRLLKPGIAVLALLCSVFLVAACGTTTAAAAGGAGQDGRHHQDRRTRRCPTTSTRRCRSRSDGWEPLLQVYPGLLVFPHKSGPAGRRAGAGPGGGHARDLGGRQDLQAQAARGPEVLGRHADQGVGLQGVDRARARAGLPGRRSFYTDIVGGEEFIEDQEGRHRAASRPTTRPARSRSSWSKPRGSFTYELAIPFAGVVPKDTPAREPDQEPAPGRGPLRDRRTSRSTAAYKLRQEPELLAEPRGHGG